MPRPSAEDLIALLGLEPHPEGGHYRETWRTTAESGRDTGTAIYFLLRAGEVSHWHRVDANETWHFYAGDPLELGVAPTGDETATWQVLGPDIVGGERPQIVVPGVSPIEPAISRRRSRSFVVASPRSMREMSL